MLLLHLFSNNGPISALKLDVPIYSPLLCLDCFSSSTLSIALAAVKICTDKLRLKVAGSILGLDAPIIYLFTCLLLYPFHSPHCSYCIYYCTSYI